MHGGRSRREAERYRVKMHNYFSTLGEDKSMGTAHVAVHRKLLSAPTRAALQQCVERVVHTMHTRTLSQRIITD